MAVYYHLSAEPFPVCHRLHYLQMWLEKLCKAHLWIVPEVEKNLQSKHNVIAQVLPVLVRDFIRRSKNKLPSNMVLIRHVCRQIDLLHPQVDNDQRRNDNVEYPWLSASGIWVAPAESKFAVAQELHQNAGRLVLQVALELTRQPVLPDN